MTRRLVLTALAGMAAATGSGTLGAPAAAAFPATVTAVTSGDTLIARANDGQELLVRVIGIDAPEPAECGGGGARDALEQLTMDRVVQLGSDPAVPTADDRGRLWFYVDRDDGLDAGLEIVRRGWAAVAERQSFQRRPGYVDAEDAALGGVWSDCDGDFHYTRAEQLRDARSSATAFVRRYYRRLSSNRFATAWEMLGRPVKRKLGHGFRSWRAGYRRSLSVTVSASRAWNRGDRVVVRVRLRSRDRDVCDGRVVRQRFRGNLIVAPRQGSWTILRFRIVKAGGATPRLLKSQCPRPEPPPPAAPPAVDCQGYDPCIAPGPDVDCAGGSGNGPRYVEGPVYVGADDPYGLDSDGDGVGCED